MASGRRFRSKVGWEELLPLLAYVAFFSPMVVMPLWSTLVVGETGGGWVGVVAFVVGMVAFVALGRYLGRPVRPEDEADDLFHRRGWRRPERR